MRTLGRQGHDPCDVQVSGCTVSDSAAHQLIAVTTLVVMAARSHCGLIIVGCPHRALHDLSAGSTSGGGDQPPIVELVLCISLACAFQYSAKAVMAPSHDEYVHTGTMMATTPSAPSTPLPAKGSTDSSLEEGASVSPFDSVIVPPTASAEAGRITGRVCLLIAVCLV